MKRVAVLLAMALCAGCAGHTKVHVEANSGSTGSSTSGQVQVRTHSGSDFATLLGLTLIAATIVEMERDSLRYRSNPFWGGPVPPLAPDRPVTEHDCTQPLPEFSGNLRCK